MDKVKLVLKGEDITAYIGKRLDVVTLDVIQKANIKPNLLSLMSRSFITIHIKEVVMVNGKVKKNGYKVKKLDIVSVDLSVLEEKANNLVSEREALLEYKADPNWKPVLDIIDENDDFMVINKPAGIPVHPGVRNTNGTIANYFKGYLVDKGLFDNRLERAGIVHRLDKSVGGLMVLAKNYEAQNALKDLFQERKVTKVYVATVKKYKDTKYTRLLEKILKESGGMTVKSLVSDSLNLKNNLRWVRVGGYIARDRNNRKKMVFSLGKRISSNAREAISYISPLSVEQIAIRIITGRTHQIRATFCAIGYDIIGDGLYNYGVNLRPSDVKEISLNAVFLSFDFKGYSHRYQL